MLPLFTTIKAFKEWRQKTVEPIAFVPTMGNLHAGHLQLVSSAFEKFDTVVISIFVNPTQFGPNEDFASYPRTMDADVLKLTTLQKAYSAEKKIIILAPQSREEIYAPHFQSIIAVNEVAKGLCAQNRPGHFQGVTTVVGILFHLVKPTAAFFGEKDFQQLQVIKQMVNDLHFDVKIIGVPIVRAENGLALSSRNQYLSPEENIQALKLPQTLNWLNANLKKFSGNEMSFQQWRKDLFGQGPGLWDYLEIYTEEPFSPWDFQEAKVPLIALGVYRLGKTRLLDNLHLGISP